MADRHHIIGIEADDLIRIEVQHETDDGKEWFYSATVRFSDDTPEDLEQGIRALGLFEDQLIPVAQALLSAWQVIQIRRKYR